MKIDAVRKFALALPEVTEQPHFAYSSFRVLGKIFVTVPPENTHIHIFVDDGVREPALLLYPDFLEKLWWGGKVRGLRVRLAAATPGVVKSLMQTAWTAKAPTKLSGGAGDAKAGKRGRIRSG